MFLNTQDKGVSIMNAPQELLKQYVQSQHFTSTAEIMAAMKDMFRDVIQQVMEVEMDEGLGRERCQRATDPEKCNAQLPQRLLTEDRQDPVGRDRHQVPQRS